MHTRSARRIETALVFNPVLPGMKLPTERAPMKRQEPDVTMPGTDEDLAFLPVTQQIDIMY